MNGNDFLLALGDVSDVYIQQAGVAGGHFANVRAKRKPRTLVRGLLVAAILAVLTVTAFAAKKLIGIRDDRWLYTPDADPTAVVQEAISRQTEKDYTVSVTVEQILVDEAETQKVLAGDSTSMLAMRGGSGADTQALAKKAQGEVAAVYARYTVVYDHEKTYYRDGTLYQYFYLVKNDGGDWEIFDSSDPAELQPPQHDNAPTDGVPADTASGPTDPGGAVQAATTMVQKWAEFGDVERITVDAVAYSEEQTARAIALLRGSTLAEGNGWTEDYLRRNLAAVEITWTTYYAPDPQLPDGSRSAETAVYWLLRDPATGAWQNSEITGFMDALD